MPEQTSTTAESASLPGYRIESWEPSIGLSLVWTVLVLVLTASAIIVLYAFDNVYGVGDGVSGVPGIEVESEGADAFTATLDFVGLLLLILVGSGVLLLHEALHGIAFRFFGARPQYGAAMINKVLPVLYCTAPGSLFTKRQMIVVLLAPVVGITLVGLALMPITNLGFWIIVPVAVNFGGSIGDFWMSAMVAMRPTGTLIEDRREGLRFYYPEEAQGSDL